MNTTPLDDTDRHGLRNRKNNAKRAFTICVYLSITVTVLWMVFVIFTPTVYNVETMAGIALIGVVLPSPFLLKAYDLNRMRTRTTFWLESRDKYTLTGVVEKRNLFHHTITVNSISVFAWELTRDFDLGDKITIEYLQGKNQSIPSSQVLKINNQSNPYFEKVWIIGPPTA